MRRPDADTNGRNLRLILVTGPGLPSEFARDLAPRLPEDLGRRIARGIRWRADSVTAPLVADEPVDVSDVAEIVGTRLEDGDWDIGVLHQLIGMAPFQGISVGVDRKSPVSWPLHERHGSLRHTVRLRSVTYRGSGRARLPDGRGRRPA
jgi:hypothetical protein